ncbi:hypothetical protein [Tenacibaculum maritimum]|uniref:hypothetical protein n=1 Tax=Tenacibaculum maritimum TaxID=107401 RepID=UPI00132F97EF|nr:hypothetical protein [Tenacibaculum maritimum]
MKKFDIIRYKQKKQRTPEYDGYYLKDSTYIRQFGNKNSGYTEYETPPPPAIFQIYREFHTNGNLKLEGETFPNDFNKGIWKEYDQDGKLIKETDYDKGFDYTWEDLLKLLKEREVDIKHRYTTIRKDEGEWWVYYVKGIYIYNIRINGRTGKITLDDKDIYEEGS